LLPKYWRWHAGGLARDLFLTVARFRQRPRNASACPGGASHGRRPEHHSARTANRRSHRAAANKMLCHSCRGLASPGLARDGSSSSWSGKPDRAAPGGTKRPGRPRGSQPGENRGPRSAPLAHRAFPAHRAVSSGFYAGKPSGHRQQIVMSPHQNHDHQRWAVPRPKRPFTRGSVHEVGWRYLRGRESYGDGVPV